ncbi:chromosome segregation ATPase [Burkholderia pseudomallei]|nr:chromosome segregation ATPase [Burkholderia pseudomallei]
MDSEATVLFAVDSPVDNEKKKMMPDEADVDSEVESEVSELFVLLRPLDRWTTS